MQTFRFPPPIAGLAAARNALRDHYRQLLAGEGVDLAFALDGEFVADMARAFGVELFGLRLVASGAADGVDALVADGRRVEVKATATRQGATFRNAAPHADHLLFFDLNIETATGTVMFNGPAHLVTRCLSEGAGGEGTVSRRQIIDADRLVEDHERLLMIADVLHPAGA